MMYTNDIKIMKLLSYQSYVCAPITFPKVVHLSLRQCLARAAGLRQAPLLGAARGAGSARRSNGPRGAARAAPAAAGRLQPAALARGVGGGGAMKNRFTLKNMENKCHFEKF